MNSSYRHIPFSTNSTEPPPLKEKYENPFRVGELVQFKLKDGGYDNPDSGGYEFRNGKKATTWTHVDFCSAGTVLEIDSGTTLKVLHQSGLVLCTNVMYLKSLSQ